MNMFNWVKLSYRIRYECVLIWLFICNDLIDCLSIGISFGIACFLSVLNRYDRQFVVIDFVIVITKCLMFTILYLLPFVITNQMPEHMILEDKLNKPYRPIPSKIVTISQAKSRLYIYTILYILLSFHYDCLISCIVWVALCYFYNFENWSRFWYFKNLVMCLGTISLLCSQWSVIVAHINIRYNRQESSSVYNTDTTGNFWFCFVLFCFLWSVIMW